jgi:hypothetical protein
MPGEEGFTLADTEQILAGLCEHFNHFKKLLELLLEVGPVRVCKTLMHKHQRMEPAVGFEPTTDGLQNRCSTTELSWLPTTYVFVASSRSTQRLQPSTRHNYTVILHRGYEHQRPTDNPTTSHFVKTNIPNLIKLGPS